MSSQYAIAALTLAALGALSLGACTPQPIRQTRGPSDVGNMAYPAPLPQGNS